MQQCLSGIDQSCLQVLVSIADFTQGSRCVRCREDGRRGHSSKCHSHVSDVKNAVEHNLPRGTRVCNSLHSLLCCLVASGLLLPNFVYLTLGLRALELPRQATMGSASSKTARKLPKQPSWAGARTPGPGPAAAQAQAAANDAVTSQGPKTVKSQKESPYASGSKDEGAWLMY